MATFVLVHGAWHGGWCWRRVADRLRAAGHRVFTPTLTGLGERAHLRSAGTGLSTHVADVCGVLRYEELRDVVLVGHSYAGFVVREAADRMPERVGRLVMVDAWAGRDGESFYDRAPERFRQWLDAATEGEVLRVPNPAAVGVTDPATAAWLEPLLTPQPRRTFSEPTRLTGAVEEIPCRAVLCVPARLPFAATATEFGWEQVELATGHDAMLTAPEELARLLLESL
ncbi:alpha/beta hydrolase [Kitasatospora acidiphila]|uniref:Alpha/beta hydrolase n=1 Tax=Kitasatospora acidiphila TaxID=2567942 RepID=A0A540W7G4_9ACTN|nr:alpha/beta hydrolase family protein [Kitasatospora acidiphila]TQF04962.1 alpha/beta hydrolase [Kitasatospora acidiphila]